MKTVPARLRTALVLCALPCIAVAVSGPAAAQQAKDGVIRTADISVRGLKRSDFPQMHKLADNVYVFSAMQVRTDIEMEFATNNLIVVTREGVLVADAQINETDTRQLLAAIGKVTPQPVKYIVVGSDHADHTGGNAAFPAGTTFIAHPTSQAALVQRNRMAGSNGTTVPIPTELVTDKKVLNLGGTEIQVLFLGRAHTGGDLSVYLPRENILFMSEAFFNRLFPSLYDGYRVSGSPP